MGLLFGLLVHELADLNRRLFLRQASIRFARRVVSRLVGEGLVVIVSDQLKLNVPWTDIITILSHLSSLGLLLRFEKNCCLSILSTVFAKAELDRFLYNVKLSEQTTDIIKSCLVWDPSNFQGNKIITREHCTEVALSRSILI